MSETRRIFLKALGKFGASFFLARFLPAIGGLYSKPSSAQNNDTDFKVKYITPKSPGFAVATRTYYPSPCKPDKVYLPRTEQELEGLISGLRTMGLRFAIRGGGHSFGNRSSNANIVIDTNALKGNGTGAHLNSNGVVSIRAGTKLGGNSVNPKKTKLSGLYDVLAQSDRILAAGTCPDVGVIGNVLGGSLSAIPLLGFGAKGLLEVTFVSLKDGKTYNVNQNRIARIDFENKTSFEVNEGITGSELLMAFRGGGQGSIGVVTEIKVKSYPMKDFKAGSLQVKTSLAQTINWLADLDPDDRKCFYLEAQFGENDKPTQIMRVMTKSGDWNRLLQKLKLKERVKEYASAKELIKSYLDNEGINSKHKLNQGATVMAPIEKDAINIGALQKAANKGIVTALYQAPSPEGTILTGYPGGSFMLELEGNSSHGNLNEIVLSALKKGKPRRFVNYVTTHATTNREDYFDPRGISILSTAMDEYNPKRKGLRISTSSLVDSSDSPTDCYRNPRS